MGCDYYLESYERYILLVLTGLGYIQRRQTFEIKMQKNLAWLELQHQAHLEREKTKREEQARLYKEWLQKQKEEEERRRLEALRKKNKQNKGEKKQFIFAKRGAAPKIQRIVNRGGRLVSSPNVNILTCIGKSRHHRRENSESNGQR